MNMFIYDDVDENLTCERIYINTRHDLIVIKREISKKVLKF